jgi:hypothetical protein
VYPVVRYSNALACTPTIARDQGCNERKTMRTFAGRPTDKQLIDRLKEISEDERYQYDPATIFENAPLALIQLEMETEARVLAWVLGVDVPRKGPRVKK